ncbi:tetratricopeptide repeat protein [Sphingomonas sanxanigenens]|uniref:Sel1 repeat family protein n=1 Tax=Sphingomonas sanxanigenens DSM 19645 = NX02 TaxID=1123269 RepID=W0AFZ3_9SPHN|nr:tetratricopeptide repeat protein [Sphingomonas sanxanigenens]AHE55203.1 hypothetical protein NX02_17645 [Sphingomonas sanxanigenens DSM 19645 = NX02]
MASIGRTTLGCLALIAAAPLPAAAQTDLPANGDGRPINTDGRAITVDGRRMPRAEAPRWATCQALVRDPHFAAVSATAAEHGVLAPAIFVPTRLPRNPDYAAAPDVPAGSPLPAVGRSRFAVPDILYEGLQPSGNDVGAGDVPAEEGSATANLLSNRAASLAACLDAYAPGGSRGGVLGSRMASELRTGAGPGTLYGGPTPGPGANFRGRETVVRRDNALPVAFLLFDQGRYAESLTFFHRAADKLQLREGGDEAALFIGKLELAGFGKDRDPARALKWLKRAATAPFNPANETPVFDPTRPELNTAVGEAAVILGNLHANGRHGLPKDMAEARRWFVRASDVGHVPAAKLVGDMHLDGIGTARDPAKAVRWYRRAAELDLPAAQVALAAILWTGDDGVKPDRDEALAWYRAAARHNHPGALYALARAQDLGEGMPADPERAITLYKAAALAGDGAAMVAMGTYFYRGEQVPRDHRAARRWFEQGAERGDADGMFNLAAMLLRGEGGTADRPKARALLRQAAVLGQKKAPAAIAAMGTN